MSAEPYAPCPIHHHAQAQPDALALWTPGRRWTYAELDAAIAATCARLREQEEGGRRVALRMRRGPDLVLLLWALWREGRVAVPLSTRWPSAKARRAVQRIGARLLVSRESDLLGNEGGDLRVRPPEQIVRKEGRGGSGSTRQSIQRRATILFTSGSTGTPKAVLHSWANHLYSAKGANANLPLRAGDRWLLSLPLYHVGGLAILVRCALAGAAVAVPDRDASLSASTERTGATHLSLVSTQLRRFLEAREGPLPNRIRGVLLGGGPVPPTLLQRGHTRGWPLHMSYGSTEMASQVTTTPPGAPLRDLLTAGRCLPHRRLRINDDGQILVAGSTLCLGMIDDGGLREGREDGWFPTGDVGHLDAEGRLHVHGRMDRQFVSGGENVQPEEIEAALERIDGIDRAVVVAIPDEEYGRRPVAFVRSEGGGEVPEGWEMSLETVLPRYKIPDAAHPLPTAALQSQMKVDRELLRKRAQEM